MTREKEHTAIPEKIKPLGDLEDGRKDHRVVILIEYDCIALLVKEMIRLYIPYKDNVVLIDSDTKGGTKDEVLAAVNDEIHTNKQGEEEQKVKRSTSILPLRHTCISNGEPQTTAEPSVIPALAQIQQGEEGQSSPQIKVNKIRTSGIDSRNTGVSTTTAKTAEELQPTACRRQTMRRQRHRQRFSALDRPRSTPPWACRRVPIDRNTTTATDSGLARRASMTRAREHCYYCAISERLADRLQHEMFDPYGDNDSDESDDEDETY
ncbi:hypothetical protein BJ878DRAFT_577532 [Calycina marina]|uniref:Uncharacterized protein n=1 Tax=Calycina marina TaxID=1763456 RepID=A0A9P7YZX6_9HELO|nr:hypothetical protein BJ878DRAFT_577532 [Calycina marina]